MSLRDDLTAMLRRYDDDAWVALANRGLLRRATKDLATLDVRVVGETGDDVSVGVGEHTVRIPASGPGEAACDCPSPVTCQHVLTAGLWLARQETSDDGPADSPPVDPDALHEELMALDLPELAAHAGTAAVRWAHQMLVDLDEPPVLQRAGYLAVTFTRPELVARYLGGGLDGLLLDRKVSAPARWRVAAVLAWQRGHGLDRQPPRPARRPAAPTEAGLSRQESRARLRAAVRALLGDTVRVGVAHLSPAVHERYTTAAVWAQGAEYHRLARVLRRLADQVDLQLARSAAADDLGLLDEVARAFGLVGALDAAAARGEEPAALVGSARTGYDPVRALDLVGLGGLPWRSGTGYHGLTCVFWSPGRQRFLTWTDARPRSMPGFDPRARWTQPGPWTGLGAPMSSAGRQLALTGALVSPDGRLSGTERTAAVVRPLDREELVERLPVTTSFAEVAEAVGGRGRSLLAPPGSGADWRVLRPAVFHPPAFDPATQLLTWPVADAEGAVLLLEVPWADHLAHVVGRVERLGTPPDGSLLVARVRRSRGRLVGEPLSLVLPGRAGGVLDCLHFDAGPPSPLVERLTASGVAERDAATGLAPVPSVLADLRAALERLAQRGTAGAAAVSLVDEVGGRHRALRDAGWPLFGAPDPALDPAETVLRSHYLLQQCELLLE